MSDPLLKPRPAGAALAGPPEQLVSIIVPCYNAADHVTEAIHSALGQTHPHVEIILIDDGSTDETLQVLSRFESVATVLSGPNQGACAARNRGLAAARGTWVQFLDADDLIHPRKIELQMAHASALAPEASSICLGEEQSQQGFIHDQMQRPLAPGRDVLDFLLHGSLATSAALHRRSWLALVGGFDTDLPCAQEFDLHLRLACHGWQLSQLAEVLFTIRRREGSLSSDSLKVLRQMPKVLTRVRELLEARNQLTIARRRSLAVAMIRSGFRLREGGAVDEAEQLTAAALSLDGDAIAQAWTPRWRPLVRVFGHRGASRVLSLLRQIRRVGVRDSVRGS